MRVRQATASDFPAIVEGFMRASAESGAAEFLPATRAAAAEGLAAVLSLSTARALLAVDGDAVIGIAILNHGPGLWLPNATVTEELLFWVRPGSPGAAVRRLLRAAEHDASDSGAEAMVRHALRHHGDRLGRIFGKMGYRHVQSTYLKRL